MLTGPEADRLLLSRPSADSSKDADGGTRPRGNVGWSDVPWRTIVGVVGVVLATYLALVLVLATVRLIAWVAVAGFFAIVLAPLVSRVQRRVGDRRTLATGIVVFSTLFTLVGVLALFVVPVRTQLVNIITDLPGTVHDAAQGKGPVGNLVKKLHVETYVQDNESKLAKAAQQLSNSAFDTLATALSAALAFVTVTLITFLFLSQSEAIGRTAINLVPRHRRASIRRIAVEAAGAVSGYVIGNLIISVIAGVDGVHLSRLARRAEPDRAGAVGRVRRSDPARRRHHRGRRQRARCVPVLPDGGHRLAGVLHRLPAGRERASSTRGSWPAR